MSGISLQFGPEWMRSKQAPTPSSATRPAQSTLPPSATQMPATSLYSSLVTNNTADQEKNSSNTPFKYSKEEMLQVWADGGGRGPLGVEIELWEGVVTELGGDPIGLKELSDSEKKLFASSLNSELRRRQSHDVLPSPLERPKLNSLSSSTQTSFGQPRFSPSLARKRREESTDLTISSLRRLSLSSPLSPSGGLMSPTGGLPSPRIRWGVNSPALENVIAEGNWRKTDEKKEDMSSNTSTLLGYNTFNGQVDEPIDHHTNTTAALNEGISGSDRDLMTGEEVQSEPENRPLGDVPKKRIGMPEADDYGTPPRLTINDGVVAPHPPGFEPDPVNITWVYRDPKGNIQGPFSASLMQKWYDEGYFAPDLLVKRSQLDNKWIMVGELAVHARNGKLFIQLYPEDLSSGCLPKSSLLHDLRPFDHFRHPLVQSDGQIVDHSIHQTLFQPPNVGNFGGVSNSYSDTSSGSMPVPLNHNVLAIAPSQDLGFQQAMSNRVTVIQPVVGGSATFEHSLAYRDDPVGYNLIDNEFSHSASMDQLDQLRTFPAAQGVHSGVQNDSRTAISLNHSLYGMSYADPPYTIHSSFSPSTGNEKRSPLNGLGVSAPSSSGEDLHRNVAFVLETPDKYPAIRDDPALMSSDQCISTDTQLYSSSENASPPITIYSLNTQEGISTDMPVETAELVQPLPATVKSNRTQSFPPNSETRLSEAVLKEDLVQNERLDMSRVMPENKGHLEVATTAPAPDVPVSTFASSRPAWKNSMPSTDEAKLGLREIQEAEAKKSEVRKLAERQKEWDIRPINTATDETPILRNTWGLSISQARNSRPASKEVVQQPSSPSSISPAPVWTNPTRVKRTMKEIQEEEELKKKALAKEKESAPNVSKRAYAESAHKSTLSGGGVWTTVGASGRHNAVTTNTTTTTHATVTRPIPITSAPHSSIPTKQTINVVNRPPSSVPLSGSRAPSKSNSSPADDPPVPPSPEFIKWLRDALRGFNVGFNTEEFMTMLLAFPLDFPPSTVEVIQDMVYMNSDTMDGRRFAAEFCSKRKGDAANRPKNADGRQPSLADIVKTQPKPLQNELPFKVVRKKGKK